MLINRLRLTGFKSFVEPTDLLIEPGLTGVVGPNGCGKSNLLEALRWVMGETSYKSMRGSAMEDVIFSGTSGRPPRNMAEVTIFVDNSARKAPAEFNDSDELEITRRIERSVGSNYSLNGREVRARDVRVLFEDAATGARSPALVRQGQIGDIVNARPDQRRRILEDAAGIAGLHSRRHDAELRLKAAETNLLRVSDVLGQMSTQIEGLKRQARQARRYGDLSDQIRKAHAIAAYLNWRNAQSDVEAQEATLHEIQQELAAGVSAEAEAIVRDTDLREAVEALRQSEAERAAALTRLTVAGETLDRDLAAATSRIAELETEATRIASDVEREANQSADAHKRIAELDDEAATLAKDAAAGSDETDALTTVATAAKTALADLEGALNAVSQLAAEEAAGRKLIESRLSDRRTAAQRTAERCARLEAELAEVGDANGALEELGLAESATATAEARLADVEQTATEAAHTSSDADNAANAAEAAASSALLALKTIETERATLIKVLSPDNTTTQTPVSDAIVVEPGFESALAAALGDDLELSTDETASSYWRTIATPDGDPPLPPDTETLSQYVQAPEQLMRTLAQIGIVDTVEAGLALQSQLATGQRLVSRDGDLWRWDGVVTMASAQTAAARRLSERNRLREIANREGELRQAHETAAAVAATASATRSDARTSATDAQAMLRHAQATLADCRAAEAGARRTVDAQSDKRATVDQALAEARIDNADLTTQVAALETELAARPQADRTEEIAAATAERDTARAALTQAESNLAAYKRELQIRAERRDAIDSDLARWRERLKSAETHIAALEERRKQIDDEAAKARAVPDSIAERQVALAGEIAAADAARAEVADALSARQTEARETAAKLRTIQSDMTATREKKARTEAHLESARARRTEQALIIQSEFEVKPEGCLRIAGIEDQQRLPDLTAADAKLTRLRAERERLGGVNLDAATALTEAEANFDKLSSERADIEAAIAKLRTAISRLNREARRRLTDAFETVNNHFSTLFEVLFGGGEAYLELIESDDPLEGGLEITAKPPGKKPVTLSLLSGGEQSLTALSLIFAVFLTNPSPICVLDEVDAPLDDANVDRFCNMMERMAQDTATRFLVITHHPMTMARMSRLFGVTMAERGVSQLVSVDLETAERFRDAS
ncbi:MAG: chromosome segregation protein SMC [Pseudomonadota bacterium]